MNWVNVNYQNLIGSQLKNFHQGERTSFKGQTRVLDTP
jgi:hypothetical protein